MPWQTHVKPKPRRIRNPVDALRYQRQVLENLRLLEAIDQELSSALSSSSPRSSTLRSVSPFASPSQ